MFAVQINVTWYLRLFSSCGFSFIQTATLHMCQFSEMEDPDANEQTRGFINKTEDLRVRRETEKTTEKQM